MTEPFPDAVSRYLRSGLAPQGEVWAWWVARTGDMCVLLRLSANEPPRFDLAVFPPNTSAWGHQLNGVSLSLTDLVAIVAGGVVPSLIEVMPPAVRDSIRVRLTGAGHASKRAVRAGYRSASRTAVYRLNARRFEPWRQLGASIPWSSWSRLIERARQDPAAAELLEDLELPSELTEVPVQPMFAPMLFVLCAAECSEDAFIIEQTDFYFADLEALAIPSSTFVGDAAVAWHLFRRCIDVSGNDLLRLPLWLSQLSSARSASVGLLSPSDARTVASSRVALESALEGKASRSDTQGLFEMFEVAAQRSDWVLGFEPNT